MVPRLNDSISNKTNNGTPSVTDTVLDNRYKIIRVIGEGGFGITYEAVNLHNGQRTAIKEHKEGKNEILLKEARLLRDFAEEPSIVSVLDSFTENDKTYMVMEYLDGITLSNEIRKNGKWSTEKTVRTFAPLMDALTKMHKAGVIHRDISPDNLMYMPDGSLVLMDFGAAKEIHENNYTRTSIYKSVYSPPEQRETGVTLGPYSDIYALCATIYYCITEREPEDSLSRLLFDELKKPSETGADILPGAEKILLKGLELNCEDRIQDISDLKNELETVYPDLSEEEKLKALQRKQRRKRILLGIMFTVIICLAALAYTYRVRIRFLSTETQKFMLNGNSLSKDEFRAQADGVKERIQAFAGKDNFLWKEEQQRIKVEIPSALFLSVDPLSFIRTNLTRPNILSVDIPDEQLDLGIFSQKEDILSVQKVSRGLLLTFSDEAAKRFGNILNETGRKVILSLNKTGGYNGYCSFEGYSDGSGSGILIDFDKLKPVTEQLAVLHFSHEPLPNSFGVQTEWKVQWEDPKNSMFPGKNQYNPEEIPSRTITVKYSSLSDSNDITGYDVSFIGSVMVLKNRLDSLNIPYAVGTDPYDKKNVIVRFPLDLIWKEELMNIGESAVIILHIGSKYAPDITFTPEKLTVKEGAGQTFSLEFTANSYDFRKYLELLQTIERQGGQEVCLYLGQELIAFSSLESAYESVDQNGSISFTRWSNPTLKMDGSTIHFANFLAAICEQNIKQHFYMQESPAEIRDENGKIIYFDYVDIMPECKLENPVVSEMLAAWRTEFNDNFHIDYTNDISHRFLALRFYHTDLYTPETALQEFETFFQNYSADLSGGAFPSLVLYLYAGENSDGGAISLDLQMDFETGSLRINDFSDDWFLFYNYRDVVRSPEERDNLLQEYKQYVRESSFWQPFLPK